MTINPESKFRGLSLDELMGSKGQNLVRQINKTEGSTNKVVDDSKKKFDFILD